MASFSGSFSEARLANIATDAYTARFGLPGAMVVVNGFDLHKAREAVQKAKRALKAEEKHFDTECDPDSTFSLINQIKAAERRLAEAQSALRKIDPNSKQ